MERLLGGTLNDRVASSRERSARVRAEQCLSMMAGLTQALGYLHFQASATHFVVHRDIKVPRYLVRGNARHRQVVDQTLPTHLIRGKRNTCDGCARLKRAPATLLKNSGSPKLRLAHALNLTVPLAPCLWTHAMRSPLSRSQPDNIGFAADGTCKLFDFGLCGVMPRAPPPEPPVHLPGMVPPSSGHLGGGTMDDSGARALAAVANGAPSSGASGGGSSCRGTPRLLSHGDAASGVSSGNSENGKGSSGRVRLRGQTGSIRYMAPEVALGATYDETVRTAQVYDRAWMAYACFDTCALYSFSFYSKP